MEPLFWLLVPMSVERLERSDPRPWRRPAVALMGLCLLLALAQNVHRASLRPHSV